MPVIPFAADSRTLRHVRPLDVEVTADPMTILIIIGITLGICSALGLFYWSAIGVRTSRALGDRPIVQRGLELSEPADGWPRLSIVVPAHNEQRVIELCAESLIAQDYPNLEIIFVLDRCTDATNEILRKVTAGDDRVDIIENDYCPDDWAGKCNAAHLGSRAATGRWILFSDADTVFDPRLSRAAMGLAMEKDIALLSLLSTLRHDHPFERIIQPAAGLTLMKIYPMEKVNRKDNARSFANGQFMLFNRSWYDRIGGHASVKDDLLEDIAFARRINDAGGRGAIALADGMLTVSMYDSAHSLRMGWKRIFIEACKRKPKRLRKYAFRLLMVSVLLPILQIISMALVIAFAFLGEAYHSIALGLITIVSIYVQWRVLRRIYPMGGAPRSAVWYYPLGCYNVARIMLDAASDLDHRRPVKWGGKEYVLEPR